MSWGILPQFFKYKGVMSNSSFQNTNFPYAKFDETLKIQWLKPKGSFGASFENGHIFYLETFGIFKHCVYYDLIIEIFESDSKFLFCETFFSFDKSLVKTMYDVHCGQKCIHRINCLVIPLIKTLVSRNFCQKGESNFRYYHTTVWKNEKFPATQIFFRQINL